MNQTIYPPEIVDMIYFNISDAIFIPLLKFKRCYLNCPPCACPCDIRVKFVNVQVTDTKLTTFKILRLINSSFYRELDFIEKYTKCDIVIWTPNDLYINYILNWETWYIFPQPESHLLYKEFHMRQKIKQQWDEFASAFRECASRIMYCHNSGMEASYGRVIRNTDHGIDRDWLRNTRIPISWDIETHDRNSFINKRPLFGDTDNLFMPHVASAVTTIGQLPILRVKEILGTHSIGLAKCFNREHNSDFDGEMIHIPFYNVTIEIANRREKQQEYKKNLATVEKRQTKHKEAKSYNKSHNKKYMYQTKKSQQPKYNKNVVAKHKKSFR
jgi:hypothetical protein